MATVFLTVDLAPHRGDDLALSFVAGDLPLDPHYQARLTLSKNDTTVTDAADDQPEVITTVTQSIPTGTARPTITVPLSDESWTGGGCDALLEVIDPGGDIAKSVAFPILP